MATDNQILITIDDVKEHRKISGLTDPEEFSAFARDAQRVNLRDLFGLDMYYDFFNDFAGGVPQSQEYLDLLNGVIYEYNDEDIEYLGLKPYLSFLWLYLYTLEGDNKHTSYGSATFVNNPQQHFTGSSTSLKQENAANYKERAVIYRNDIIRFLSENSSSYPLWNGASQQDRTSMSIIIL